MRFSSRLIFCTAAPATLFICALLSSHWGLTKTQNDFETYLNRDQAIVTQLQELYAQGLQSGQAVRNIVLNPSDQQAVKNLDTARQAYDTAYVSLKTTAQGTPLEATVARLQALREKQNTEQDHVVAQAASNQLAAAAALKNNETPAWRQLRSALLEQLQLARDAANTTHITTLKESQQLQIGSAFLALFAIAASTIMLLVMVRTLHRELGCDPAVARAALRRVSDGDLVDDQTSQSHAGLMSDLQQMRQSLRTLVQQVQRASVEMNHASQEIAQGNADLSNRTENQASALQETATSMEQLNSAVQQNSDNAQTANKLAQDAAEVAHRGGEVVERVVENMKDISASSQRIAEIIGVIDGIAFQTNILALNAAVEAARAGEQGRGFAVVAGEV